MAALGFAGLAACGLAVVGRALMLGALVLRLRGPCDDLAGFKVLRVEIDGSDVVSLREGFGSLADMTGELAAGRP